MTPILRLLSLLALLMAHARAAGPLDQFYDPTTIQDIRLTIAPADLDRLQRALPQRLAVPATFQWNTHSLTNVAVRYKGNSSSSPNSPHKRSFLLDFPQFEKGRRFLGLRHVALDNAIQFGGLYSEILITTALRDLGLKASRCNYARLHLNGKFLGVHVNVERIDQSFLDHHFADGRGPLFKVDEGGPGADLRFIGDDPNLYRKAFELHSGREKEAYTALLDLIRSLDSPDLTDAALRRQIDLDAFLKTTAVLLFAGAFDQYTGWNPHNYYLYLHPPDQRWTYLPWDLDVGFADRAFGHIPVLDGWHAAWPAPAPGRPLLERVIASPTLLKEYRAHAAAILESHFHPDILIPKLRSLHALIQDDLARDPFPPRRATNPSDQSHAGIVASIENFIRQRHATARALLADPGPRPAFQPAEPSQPPAQQDGPTPGPPSPDAPTGLRAVNVTPSSVELRWTDHADGEVAYVVQRSQPQIPGAASFANAIGLPGPAITSATDRNVQPGQTYHYRVYAVLPTPQGPRGTGVSNTIEVQIPAP